MILEGGIVIVGAGEAGVAAAAAVRDDGYRGSVTLLNGESDPPYERPPLSKHMLLGVTVAQRLIRPSEWYVEQDITIISDARVTAIDPGRQTATVAGPGGEWRLAYEKLLFATGARPRRLPGAPAEAHVLRTSADCLQLRARLASAHHIAIVGAGIIGLEVASVLRGAGKRVTVLDVAERVMARAVVPGVSNRLRAMHEENGVSLHLGRNFEFSGRDIRLDDDSILSPDVILLAIGVLPNTELAEAAGCRVDGGILVDGCGRTSIDGLYAAGDVARFSHPVFDRLVRIESWQHAGRHGAHVARAMMGHDDDGYHGLPWFWTDQYGVNLQVVGSIDETDATVWRADASGYTALHFADGRLVAGTTIDNGRDMRPISRLIAARWRGDPQQLADPATQLGRLARDLAAGG